MHALVITVSIESSQVEASQKTLKEQVVPRVKSAPGFVKGYWTAGSNNQGLSLVVFRTEQDAKNAAEMARSMPPPAGVTITSAEIREVVAEA